MIPAYQILDGQRLSSREAEVLLCCVYDYTMQQTADKLCIAYKTVDNICTRIRTKFGLSGTHALYKLALKLQPELEIWIGTGLKIKENAKNRGEFPTQ